MKDTLNWGVVGTGGIATDFANALTKSKRCRIVNVTGIDAGAGARLRRQMAHPGDVGVDRRAARRQGGRGGLHRDAAPVPREDGDGGDRGGQAGAVREADRARRRIVGEGDRGRPQEGRLPDGRLHVPRPPADARGGQAAAGGRHREDPARARRLRLPRAARSGGTAVRHQPGRRRHPRRRRLRGVVRAPDRRASSRARRSPSRPRSPPTASSVRTAPTRPRPRCSRSNPE